jgi:glycosyltransferase involved in cell wall biosynthesis
LTTLHVVSLPHTQTTQAFSACAYTEKVRKFCIMMKARGFRVLLYAGEQNEAPCDEHIVCMSEFERKQAVGGGHYTHASFDWTLPHWQWFNTRVIEGIKARAAPKDIICVIAGIAHKPIADAFPLMITCEFGIGYGGTFAKYRVWESYAWMHACYGAACGGDPHSLNGLWFDEVIPSYIEPEQFPFNADKDDYFLFMGRLTERKGPHIAAEVCQRMGHPLIIAGQGVPPAYGEHVGVVGPEERGKLMSNARAVFVPTIYVEPFGTVAIEAMACGTPVISTDWGAMTETVTHGVTGFRCRSLAEFCKATEDVSKLDPYAIRKHAINNYSLPVVAQKYHDYFDRLSTLWEDGWYQIEPRQAATKEK